MNNYHLSYMYALVQINANCTCNLLNYTCVSVVFNFTKLHSISFLLTPPPPPPAPECQQQAHVSICNLERVNDNGYGIKTFKQKLVVSYTEQTM